MRISDWSSDVCSSDLNVDGWHQIAQLIVRVNPDIIRFGETRDTEVLRQAIAQAFAGKLVVTTVHATNAPQILPRFLQLPGSPPISPDVVFAPDLHKALVSQRLPGLLCGCSMPLAQVRPGNSAEARGGQGGVSTCRSR